jgi:hypothetical protein
MTLTLATIRSEVKANIKDSLITDNRLSIWANLAQEELWRSLDPEYGKETTTFTTTASQRQYNLEISNNKLLSVVDQTNNIRIQQRGETELERLDPDVDETGNPVFYSLYGMTHINNQPTAASTITVVSSSGTDTTQTVELLGISGGVEAAETLTLNGVVNVTSAISFTSLIRAVKSATTAGSISVTSNAGAVVNVSIPARRLLVEYQPLRFWPIPNGAFTVLIRYIRNPIPMVASGDIPDLPFPWHSLLLELTMVYAHQFVYEFDIANAKRVIVQDQIKKLTADQAHKRDYAPVIGRTEDNLAFKRLPSNFPINT